MTTEKVRVMLGDLTQREFAEMFNIPLRTVENWDYRNCMPHYVLVMCRKIVVLKECINMYKPERSI